METSRKGLCRQVPLHHGNVKSCSACECVCVWRSSSLSPPLWCCRGWPPREWDLSPWNQAVPEPGTWGTTQTMSAGELHGSFSQWKLCREIEFQCNARHLQRQVGLNNVSLFQCFTGNRGAERTSGKQQAAATSLKLCLKKQGPLPSFRWGIAEQKKNHVSRWTTLWTLLDKRYFNKIYNL